MPTADRRPLTALLVFSSSPQLPVIPYRQRHQRIKQGPAGFEGEIHVHIYNR